MIGRDKVWLIVFGLIAVVFVALRLWNLTASCLWFDEIFSVHAATRDWETLFWFAAQDLIHPPLFYVLLKIWIAVGGESLFNLRFLSVFFSIVAIFPFLLLCRQLKLPNPTIALAFGFFAVNGSLVKYAQEVRMYSLLLCAGLFSMWLFARLVNSGRGFWWLLVVNILLVHTHYFGWLIVASEIVAAAILAREKLKQILLMTAILFLSFAPWSYAVWQASKINADVGQNIGWMTRPNFSASFQFVFDLFEPIYFEQSNHDSAAIYLIALPILLIGLVALSFQIYNLKSETKTQKKNFFLILILFITPILLAFAASWILPYSIWGTRHLIFAFALFAVLLADSLAKIEIKQLKLAGVAVIFLLVSAAFLLQLARPKTIYIWCAWENLAANLPTTSSDLQNGNSNEPTKIYVFEDLVAYSFWFALRDSEKKFQIVKINDIQIEDKAYFLPRGFDAVKVQNDFQGDDFFIAFRAENWNESAPPLQNLKAQNYKIGEPQIFEAQGLKAFLVRVSK